MTTGYGTMQDQNLEKQMGCMAGFLQLFDRHHIMASKKLNSTKRLPPFKVVDLGQDSEKSSASSSPSISRELGKPQSTPTPLEHPVDATVPMLRPPELLPPKSPLPLPIFEFKDGSRSSWKFCKEAPRLSLDSRATVDDKGSLHPREIRTNSSILSANAGDADDKQRRSPSVIARLMGLEPLPESNYPVLPAKNVELRRSVSESRVSRDFSHYRLINNVNNNNFQSKQSNAVTKDENHKQVFKSGGIVSSPWKSPQHRKIYFDAADVFPEPKNAISVSGDIEKRLRLRGIDEASKDLETLKQILEALQLKGLLHSNNRPPEQRNFVYDRNSWPDESPIVVMTPSRSPVNRRMGAESPPSRYGVRRNTPNNHAGEHLPTASPRRERPAVDQNVRSPTRAGNSISPNRSSNSIAKPKPLSLETQGSNGNRRISPAVHWPKLISRKNGHSRDPAAKNRSLRCKRSTAVVIAEDELSSISESTISTSSQTDTEKSKMEYTDGGRSLLERCDKLLYTIAEMSGSDMQQPSPVSVLDSSSFYKDKSWPSSPSPVIKRCIDFNDNERADQSSDWDEDTWSCIFRPDESTDRDLVYISEILMASHYLPEDCDVFLLLEKQQYLKGKDTSKVSGLQRKLTFDVIVEILERNRHLPPWKSFSWSDSRAVKSSVRRIWSEFLRIRERHNADDLFDTICGVLRKDLAGDAINSWGDCPVELCEAVLDIERMVFKDLIGETIRDLAAFTGRSKEAFRRKLIFWENN